MPVFHGDLAGHERRAPAVTLFEDLQQVVTCSGIQRLQPPIVENQYLRRGQRGDYAAMPTIHARKGKVGEELRHTVIENDRLSRQARCASAEASQLFPRPVLPHKIRLSCASIHFPAVSFWNSARSSPRGVR